MAAAGIGVDMLEIARMQRVIDRRPSFLRRVFTEEERAYCERCARPAEHYAARWAAREAVVKALGSGFGNGVGVRDVCVTRDERGGVRRHFARPLEQPHAATYALLDELERVEDSQMSLPLDQVGADTTAVAASAAADVRAAAREAAGQRADATLPDALPANESEPEQIAEE